MPSDPPDDPILSALRARDSSIRDIHYRQNRSVLLSVSRDGRTLNSHACFRNAPPEIVEAILRVVTGKRDSPGRRRALRTIREWQGTRDGLDRARRRKAPRRRPVNGGETAPLRILFRRLNRDSFGGRLPEIPLRLSQRMIRTLGTVRYGGPDTVVEIAISADLLRPSNQSLLEDTMLHEMAHAEAWLQHGHRGHGAVWKTIARRVGCRPRAVNDIRVSGRRR